jgi:hypothetical protein
MRITFTLIKASRMKSLAIKIAQVSSHAHTASGLFTDPLANPEVEQGFEARRTRTGHRVTVLTCTTVTVLACADQSVHAIAFSDWEV